MSERPARPVYGRRALVSAMHHLGTQAGVRVMAGGGNAVDAAVAAAIAMTVALPPACSAAGDLYLLLWDGATRTIHALDGGGAAPAGLTREHLAARRLSAVPWRGALSVTVPGAVDGWFAALRRFGRAPVEAVFAPALELATEGAPVTADLSSWIAGDAARILGAWGGDPGHFLPRGRPPTAGELLYQEDLARTYRTLVREGAAAFYEGDLARRIVAEVAARGGVLTLEDMRRHRSRWVTTISTSYRGHEVHEFPPPSQGVVALEMLNILEGFDLRSMGHLDASCVHVMVEAARLATADRDAFVSDPAFVDVPVERLLSAEHALARRAMISPDRPLPPARVPAARQGDTVAVVAADPDGSLAVLMQSVGSSFGSGIVVPGTGLLLHNRAYYFSLDPDHVNLVEGGKRTMHTFMPALVLRDGEPFAAMGSIGGDVQPQVQVQLLSALVDHGLALADVLAVPRWRCRHVRRTGAGRLQELNGQRGRDRFDPAVEEVVLVEGRMPEAAVEGLAERGHAMVPGRPWDHSMGPTQAVVVTPGGVREGAPDPRTDGLALGW